MRLRLPLVALVALLALPATLHAQAPLPARVKAIVQALYDRNVALSEGNDDQRRALAKMIAEQTTCELGSEWGWKSASPTRPPSKDAIAHKLPGGRLEGWDLFNGTTRKPNGGIWHDLTGQTFIEVSNVDHLGVGCAGSVPPPDPDPDPDPPPTDPTELTAILAEIKAVRLLLEKYAADDAARDTALRAELAAVIAELQKQIAAGIKIRF